jgi:hypothetical protein
MLKEIDDEKIILQVYAGVQACKGFQALGLCCNKI